MKPRFAKRRCAVLLGLIVAIFSFLAACLGSNEQSPEFKRAKTKLDQVITQTFDDSFTDPKFKDVLTAFEQVPEGDRDYRRAQSYVKKIRAAQVTRILPETVSKTPAKTKSDDEKGGEGSSKKGSHSEDQDELSSGRTKFKSKKPDERSSQKKAYDRAVNGYKKAEKERGRRLKEIMKEVDDATKGNAR